MKVVRNLADYKLIDQKHNTDIRAELSILHVRNKIEHRKRNWYEHILRMKESRLPHAFLQYKTIGRRNVSRPKTRWIDDLF
jgi:hypothetical protein